MNNLTITLLAMLAVSWLIILLQNLTISDLRKTFVEIALLRGIDSSDVTEEEWAEAYERLQERGRKKNHVSL